MVTPRRATSDVLIQRMQAYGERPCGACGQRLCHHERLMSVAAGYGPEPRCEACLVQALGQPRERLRGHLEGMVHTRTCYADALAWAERAEEESGAPACRWSSTTAAAAPEPAAEPAGAPPPHDCAWDAGDKGCGELVLELRQRMAELEPGHVMQLTATDPGAPADIPSWCRLTGHALVHAAHPTYWVRRRA